MGGLEDSGEAPDTTGGLAVSDIPASIRREAQSREFQPSVRIGKTGITDALVEEIKSQLTKRKLVKIKINKGIYERSDREVAWAHLEEVTNSTLVLSRGNVGVLWLSR